MISLFPNAWAHTVSSIVLCHTNEAEVTTSFHPKEKVLELCWPGSPQTALSKTTAVDALLVAIAAITDMGHLPENLSAARQAEYRNAVSDVRAQCLETIDAQPGAPADAR